MEHEATAHHNEHPPTTIRQYVLIGAVLTVITLIELWLSYSGLPDGALIGGLIALSALKFVIVVALFMHLRFDSPLFTRLFIFGLALAASLLFALIALFWGDHHDNLTPRVYATPGGVAHSEEGGDDHGEGTETAGEGEGEGEGEGAPTGDLVVAGMPAGDFFQANCAVCHGQNREGGVGLPLLPSTLTQPDAFYEDTIRNGRTGTAMPPWGNTMSDEDITNMVHFLKTVEP